MAVTVLNNALIKITVGCFNLCQNLNKQAYDLAKTLLKRTVQTIETCIANVSSANCDSLGRLPSLVLVLVFPSACTIWCLCAYSFDKLVIYFLPQFFNQVLVMGKSSVSDLSEHVFDLIQELFAIDPMLLTSVMPQLEFKLKVITTHSSRCWNWINKAQMLFLQMFLQVSLVNKHKNQFYPHLKRK